MQESHQSRIIQNYETRMAFLASQLDAAGLLEEAAGKGPPSKARLAMILPQKGLAVSDFHDKTQCPFVRPAMAGTITPRRPGWNLP